MSSKPFIPELVYFEPASLDYPKGQRIYQWAKSLNLEIRKTTSHNRVTNLPGNTDLEKYKVAKNTLVVGLRKTLKFEQSKPSAEYAIPIATGCMAHCHYCYLQTTLGAKPYIRIYVNTDEILEAAGQYIEARAPEITRFEAACTSDPVGIEHISGSLAECITFMAQQPLGRLRFVTKFPHVDTLLNLDHQGHTRIRFSLNAEYVVKYFEPGTAPIADRIAAARKIQDAGYPLGFIIAPLIWHDGWEAGYENMMKQLAEALGHDGEGMTFELIQHRFTKPAKRIIEKNYPKSKLDLNESTRKRKWGRYGIHKFVYADDQAGQLEQKMRALVQKYFARAAVEYFT